MASSRRSRAAKQVALDENMKAWSFAAFNSAYLPALILALGAGVAVPVIPAIAQSFHVDFAVATGVTTSFLLGNVAGTLPAGWFIDRYGRRRIMLAGPLLTAAMAFAVLVATNYVELLAMRFLDGFATQLWLMGRVTGISHGSAADQRGRQITWMFSMDNAGRALGPLVGAVIAGTYGVRSPFVAYGALALLALVPAFRYLGDTPTSPKRASGQRSVRPYTYRELIRSRGYIFAISLLAACTRGPIQASLLNLYAAFRYHLHPAAIGYLASAAAGIMIPVGFVSGWLIDRFGRKIVIVPAYSAMMLSMVGLAITAFFHLSIRVYVGVFLVTALCQGATNGTMQTIAADVAPSEARGMFFGLWRFLSQGGVALSPIVFAALSGTFGYGASFLFVGSSAAAVASIVTLKVHETVHRPEPERSIAPEHGELGDATPVGVEPAGVEPAS